MQIAVPSANVRAGAGTDHGVIARYSAGRMVAVVQRVDGWAQVQGGGWISEDLLRAPATSDGPRKLYRWSYMDLNGVLFEVGQIHPRSGMTMVLAKEFEKTGLSTGNWTYFRVAISVPGTSGYSFRFAPHQNLTVVEDRAGEKYANQVASGSLEELPTHLRQFFEPMTIGPGERYEGVLLFRPHLAFENVDKLGMYIGGRLQEFMGPS